MRRLLGRCHGVRMDLLVIWQLWQEFRAKTALNPRRRYSGCESSRLVLESRSSIDFFTSRTLSSNSTAQARSPANANAENGVCGSVHDSLLDGGCKVDSLPAVVFPSIPQPSKGEQRVFDHSEVKRLLEFPCPSPFVKAVCWD